MARLTAYDVKGLPYLRDVKTAPVLGIGVASVQVPRADWLAVLQKLAGYENAEEAGLLHRTPCPPDTTVYIIRLFDPRYGTYVYEISEMAYDPHYGNTRPEDFGRYWFLTRAEAEEALRIRDYVGYEIECSDGVCRERYIPMDQEDAFLLALGAHRHVARRKEGHGGGGDAQTEPDNP